jgi:hypothetical protein
MLKLGGMIVILCSLSGCAITQFSSPTEPRTTASRVMNMDEQLQQAHNDLLIRHTEALHLIVEAQDKNLQLELEINNMKLQKSRVVNKQKAEDDLLKIKKTFEFETRNSDYH